MHIEERIIGEMVAEMVKELGFQGEEGLSLPF